jgi:hypothetical protein
LRDRVAVQSAEACSPHFARVMNVVLLNSLCDFVCCFCFFGERVVGLPSGLVSFV